MHRLTSAAAIVFAGVLAACSTTPDLSASEARIDAGRMSEHVRVLSDDSFLGRGIATEGETKTIAYLSEHFAAAGFEPGGENGGWTQAVTLNRFTVSGINASLSVGDWSQPLVQGEQAVFTSRLPGARIDIKDAPLVFVGYGIKAPERQWDDFKGQDLRSKILVVLINDADFDEPALNTFGGKAMTYYGRWTYKYEEAARQGAAGVIIVHEAGPASYGWTTVDNSWSGPQFDIVRDNPAADRVSLESWVQRDVAVEMFRRAGLDFEALRAQARQRDFQPVALPGARLNAAFDVSTSRIQTQNVLARLPGTRHANETILYTAHWDHIGVGDADANGDAIFNGAVDNASGLAGLLELARLWGAAPRAERSVVMIGFTAEESGLLGSEYYAANPVYPLATTVGGFNMDSLNVYGRVTDLGVVGFGQSDLDERLAAAAQRQGRTMAPDARPEAGGYFRSDQFPLAKRGVPLTYARGGGAFRDEPMAARSARRDRYTAERYHQADDEWWTEFDFSGAIEDLEIFWQIGRDLADSRSWPAWKPGSEFAPARAQTDGARR